MSVEFKEALKRNQDAFGLELSDEKIEVLNAYRQLIEERNAILHLVGPCSEEEFAIRHVLESVFMLSISGPKRTFIDIGSGAGFPGIPCLIAGDELKGYLVESKEKKASFLLETAESLGIASRCRVINRQFEEIEKPNAGVVVSRALDKFTKKLPSLIQWAGNSTVLLFAGEAVKAELEKLRLNHKTTLIPLSERRFIFEVSKPKKKARRDRDVGAKGRIRKSRRKLD